MTKKAKKAKKPEFTAWAVLLSTEPDGEKTLVRCIYPYRQLAVQAATNYRRLFNVKGARSVKVRVTVSE